MTPAAKEGLPAVVGELVAKWREPSTKAGASWIEANARRDCANELEATLSALTAEAGKGEREIEVLRHERDHARGCYDRAVRILAGIHAVIYPEIVKLADGRTFAFNSPLLREQMQALSDRIRAIPDELALSTATPAGEWVLVPRESTDAMHTAYLRAKYDGPKPTLISDLWAAMLAASPRGASAEEG